MKQSNLIIIFVIIIILVGGGAFYGGMKFSQGQKGPGNFSRTGQMGGANARRATGNNFVNGSIIAKDDKSITVKLTAGGSKIILYSSATEIGKMASGTLNDLNVGTSIMATGKANADGSISAQSIQIRPAGMPGGFGGPGAGGNNPGQTPGGTGAGNPNPGNPGQIPGGAPQQ